MRLSISCRSSPPTGATPSSPVVGGSCLNVAIGIARLGAPAGFVGGISTDLFGRMIAEHAQASQVDLRYAARCSRPTTLAFVQAVDDEPQYAFYDEGTAARHWTYRQGSIPFAEIDAIHVGSTTLVDGGAAAQTLAMVEDARGSTTISFDPNCRPNLIGDKAEYVRRMDQFAAHAHIVRLSDTDFAFLYGGSDHAGRAEALLAAGTGLFVITRGAQGAQAWHGQAGAIEVEAPRVDVVDTDRGGRQFSGRAFVRTAGHGPDQGRAARRASAPTSSIAHWPSRRLARPSRAGVLVLTHLVFPRSAPDRSTPSLASDRPGLRWMRPAMFG